MMRMVDVDMVIPKLEAMADASEKSIQGKFSEGVGGEIAREVMKAIAGTLRAVVKILTDHGNTDVVPVRNMAEFLAGYCIPPDFAEKNIKLLPTSKDLTQMWDAWIRAQNWT